MTDNNISSASFAITCITVIAIVMGFVVGVLLGITVAL